jgi:hypothetical protein
MRGRRPSPLDDSGAKSALPRLAKLTREASSERTVTPCGAATEQPAPPPLSSLRRRRGTTGTARRRASAISSPPHADVAELVDAHGSGPCPGNRVEVRVLSSASPKCLQNSRFAIRDRN